MCAYKLIRLPTTLLLVDVKSRRDLRFDPVPIASSSSYALHDDDDDDDDVLLRTSSLESEMQANLPHDLTTPPTYEYSSTSSRVARADRREKETPIQRELEFPVTRG